MALSIIFFIWVAAIPSALGWEQWRGDKVHSAYVKGETPEKGELIWSYRAGDQVLSSVGFYRGDLLIRSDDGWLYCFDPPSGEMNWRFKTGGSIQATDLVHSEKANFGNMGMVRAMEKELGRNMEVPENQQIVTDTDTAILAKERLVALRGAK